MGRVRPVIFGCTWLNWVTLPPLWDGPLQSDSLAHSMLLASFFSYFAALLLFLRDKVRNGDSSPWWSSLLRWAQAPSTCLFLMVGTACMLGKVFLPRVSCRWYCIRFRCPPLCFAFGDTETPLMAMVVRIHEDGLQDSGEETHCSSEDEEDDISVGRLRGGWVAWVKFSFPAESRILVSLEISFRSTGTGISTSRA